MQDFLTQCADAFYRPKNGKKWFLTKSALSTFFLWPDDILYKKIYILNRKKFCNMKSLHVAFESICSLLLLLFCTMSQWNVSVNQRPEQPSLLSVLPEKVKLAEDVEYMLFFLYFLPVQQLQTSRMRDNEMRWISCLTSQSTIYQSYMWRYSLS